MSQEADSTSVVAVHEQIPAITSSACPLSSGNKHGWERKFVKKIMLLKCTSAF